MVVALAVLVGAACGDDGTGGPGGDAGGGADAGSGGADGGPGVDGGIPPEVPDRVLRYLRPDRAASFVLEVDSVAGTEPTTEVRDRFATGFADVVDKPGGVTVTLDGTIASRGTDHAWTNDELRTLADETFDLDASADAVKMHAVFVDGHYAGDDEGSGVTLGITYDHTHFFLFAQSVEEACAAASIGPLLREDLCNAAVLNVMVHEAGHVIGLVNRGLPMVTDHEDADHPRHDGNDECVMYWVAETGQLVDALVSRIVGGGDGTLPFDAACLADVAAIRD